MSPLSDRPRARLLLLTLVLALVLSLAASTAFAGGQVTAKHAALSTDSPLATKAALSILRRGGTAADAAVAAALVLAVVRPDAGNLGGGGFLVYYDASTRGIWTLDFRELSPRGATKDLFAKVPEAAQRGALSAAVPGSVAGLDALHGKFGKLPWNELFAPAIALAREGVKPDDELAAAIERAKAERNLDVSKGLPPRELASTLQRIAENGARDFYDGDIAKKIVEGLKGVGGIIGYRDLREYEPVWRAPIKLEYGDYEMYTVPPPSGGSIVIGETLNILAGDDLRALGFQTPESLHLLVEAEQRAFIDRMHYIGDPAGGLIPYRDLLSRQRAEQWRKTIDPKRAVATAMLTEPRGILSEAEHTTHLTIADASGNIVSLTTSLGGDFGSGVVAPGLGFFLNNAMNDFTTGANALAPRVRPASSLSPMIVLRKGQPFLALGTSGGGAIPTTILEVFLNLVVYGKSLVDAIAAPRWHHQAVPDEVRYEKTRAPQKTVDALNQMGHAVSSRDAIGDVHAILFENDHLIAVADPRHGGAAGGY